jgi:hypothetical protein
MSSDLTTCRLTTLRASDAFRDEDGFVGHEFYVESADGRSMERVTAGLVPVVSHHPTQLIS